MNSRAAESGTLPLIADHGQRRQAVRPDDSFIVQAPAGSGKTSLLTLRFLALLGRVRQPEEILAITFTRKAAAEMKGRILDALEGARSAPAPAEPHLRQGWELARAALQRDAALSWELSSSPERLRVMTIDALCSAITGRMPLLSRFGGAPKPTDDASEMYLLAAQRALDLLEEGGERGAAIGRLLLHLDNNRERVEEMLVTMLARRDQWLRLAFRVLPGAGEDDGGDPQRRELERGLQRVVGETVLAVRRAIPRALRGELAAVLSGCWTVLGRPPLPGSGPYPWPTEGDDPLPRADGTGTAVWLWFQQTLQTQKGRWRGTLNKTQGVLPPSASRDPQQRAALQATKARATALLDELRQVSGLEGRLATLQILPAVRYSEEQWQVLQDLIQLLLAATVELKLVFQQRGTVDFIEVAQSARRALGSPEQPTDLALALDYRIQHLLVDEFQDTSVSQIDLLEMLTAGWQAGDGRTLFLVGDPMQSIYRFREADVGLFLRARRLGLGGVEPTPLTLSTNFRSDAGVVAWVNEAFPRVLPEAEEITSGAVPYSPSQARPDAPDGPAVEVHPLLGADDEAEAERVVELVRREQAAGHRVAVLVRTRSHLGAILPALRRAGLRAMAVKVEPLARQQGIRDLIALCRALLHVGDRLSWLALLRAPWCGLTLCDLERLCGGEAGARAAIWQRLGDPAVLGRLSADGRTRAEGLRGVMARWLARRGRLPLRRLVEGAWLELGGPACLEGEHRLQDARVFFELLDGLDRGGGLDDLDALERAVQGLYAAPDAEADDRLQLMTIHAAKGLEFDCVILPGLARRPRADDPRILRWLERPRAEGRSADLLLAPIQATDESAPDPIYHYLRQVESLREEHETGRLLYVAATRAKHRLHLLGAAGVKHHDDGSLSLKPPPGASLLGHLWPAVQQHYAEALARSSHQPSAAERGEGDEADEPGLEPELDSGDQPEPNLRRLPADWKPPPMPPEVD